MNNLLFLNKKLNKKAQNILEFLIKNNPELAEETRQKLNNAENDFVTKLQKRNKNILFSLKKFLSKKKSKLNLKTEIAEKDKALEELNKLIDQI